MLPLLLRKQPCPFANQCFLFRASGGWEVLCVFEPAGQSGGSVSGHREHRKTTTIEHRDNINLII